MKLFTRHQIWILCLTAVAFLGLFSYSYPKLYPENFIINIEEAHENNFVTESEIKKMIQEIGINNPGIMKMESMNLRRLEEHLQQTDFIRRAQVSRDLKGNLIVDISQDVPLARIISASGKQGYVSEDSTILPLSDNFTSRVVLLTGHGADSLFTPAFFATSKGKKLYKFIQHINQQAFWKSQIAQLDLDEKLNLTIYPQIGKQKIEFGPADEYQGKLKKLQVFYDQIVPARGWNTYSVVKLQYKGQIVCD